MCLFFHLFPLLFFSVSLKQIILQEKNCISIHKTQNYRMLPLNLEVYQYLESSEKTIKN